MSETMVMFSLCINIFLWRLEQVDSAKNKYERDRLHHVIRSLPYIHLSFSKYMCNTEPQFQHQPTFEFSQYYAN